MYFVPGCNPPKSILLFVIWEFLNSPRKTTIKHLQKTSSVSITKWFFYSHRSEYPRIPRLLPHLFNPPNRSQISPLYQYLRGKTACFQSQISPQSYSELPKSKLNQGKIQTWEVQIWLSIFLSEEKLKFRVQEFFQPFVDLFCRIFAQLDLDLMHRGLYAVLYSVIGRKFQAEFVLFLLVFEVEPSDSIIMKNGTLKKLTNITI